MGYLRSSASYVSIALLNIKTNSCSSHLCWSHNRKSGTEVIAERTALEPADKKDNIGNFSVNHKSGGSLFLGPIVECPDEKHQYAFRKRNARYLREILFGAGACKFD